MRYRGEHNKRSNKGKFVDQDDKQSSSNLTLQVKEENQQQVKLEQNILKKRRHYNDTIILDFQENPYLNRKVDVADLIQEQDRLERLQDQRQKNQVLQIRSNLSIFNPLNDNEFDNLLHVEYAFFNLKKSQKPQYKVYGLKDDQWRKLNSTRQVANEMMVNFQNMKSGLTEAMYQIHYFDPNLVDQFEQQFLKTSMMLMITKLIYKFIKKKYPKQKLKWITKPKKKFVYYYVAKSLVYAKDQYDLEVADIFYRVINLVFKINYPKPVTYMQMLILFLAIQYKYARTVDEILDRKNQIYFPQKKCEGMLVQYVQFNPKSQIYDLSKGQTSQKNLTIYYYDVKGQKKWTPKFQTVVIKMYLKVQSFSGLKDIFKQKYEWKDHNEGDFGLIKIRMNMQAIFRVAISFCQLQFNALVYQLKLQDQLSDNQKRFLLINSCQREFIGKRDNAVITRKLVFDYYLNNSIYQEYYQTKLKKLSPEQQEKFLRHKYNYLNLILESCAQFLVTIEHLPSVYRHKKAQQEKYMSQKGRTKQIQDFHLTKLQKLYYNHPISKVYYQYDEGTGFRNIIQYHPLELVLNAVNTKLQSKSQQFVWDQSADRLLMRMFIQVKNSHEVIKNVNSLLKKRYQIKEKQLEYTLDRSSRLCYGFGKYELARLIIDVFQTKQISFATKKFIQMNSAQKAVIFNRYEAGHVRLLMYDYYLNNYNRKKAGTIEQQRYRLSYLTYIAEGTVEMLLKKVYLHKVMLENYTEVKDKKYRITQLRTLKTTNRSLTQCLKQQENVATKYDLKYQAKLESVAAGQSNSAKINGLSKILKDQHDQTANSKGHLPRKIYSYEYARQQNKYNYSQEQMFEKGWVPEPQQRPEPQQIPEYQQRPEHPEINLQEEQSYHRKINQIRRANVTGQSYRSKNKAFSQLQQQNLNRGQQCTVLPQKCQLDSIHGDIKGKGNTRVLRSCVNRNQRKQQYAFYDSNIELHGEQNEHGQRYQLSSDQEPFNRSKKERLMEKQIQKINQVIERKDTNRTFPFNGTSDVENKINAMFFKEIQKISQQSAKILLSEFNRKNTEIREDGSRQKKDQIIQQNRQTIGLVSRIYAKYDPTDKLIMLRIKDYLNKKKQTKDKYKKVFEDQLNREVVKSKQINFQNKQKCQQSRLLSEQTKNNDNKYDLIFNQSDGSINQEQVQNNEWQSKQNIKKQQQSNEMGNIIYQEIQLQGPHIQLTVQEVCDQLNNVKEQIYFSSQQQIGFGEYNEQSDRRGAQNVKHKHKIEENRTNQSKLQTISQQNKMAKKDKEYTYKEQIKLDKIVYSKVQQGQMQVQTLEMICHQGVVHPKTLKSQQDIKLVHSQQSAAQVDICNSQVTNKDTNLKQQHIDAQVQAQPSIQDNKGDQLSQNNQQGAASQDAQTQYSSLPIEEDMQLQQINQYSQGHVNRVQEPIEERMTLDQLLVQLKKNKKIGVKDQQQEQSSPSEDQDQPLSDQQSQQQDKQCSQQPKKRKRIAKDKNQPNEKLIVTKPKGKAKKQVQQQKQLKSTKQNLRKNHYPGPLKLPHQLQVDEWEYTNMRNRGRKRGVKLSQIKNRKNQKRPRRKNSSSQQSQLQQSQEESQPKLNIEALRNQQQRGPKQKQNQTNSHRTIEKQKQNKSAEVEDTIQPEINLLQQKDQINKLKKSKSRNKLIQKNQQHLVIQEQEIIDTEYSDESKQDINLQNILNKGWLQSQDEHNEQEVFEQQTDNKKRDKDVLQRNENKNKNKISQLIDAIDQKSADQKEDQSKEQVYSQLQSGSFQIEVKQDSQSQVFNQLQEQSIQSIRYKQRYNQVLIKKYQKQTKQKELKNHSSQSSQEQSEQQSRYKDLPQNQNQHKISQDKQVKAKFIIQQILNSQLSSSDSDPQQ